MVLGQDWWLKINYMGLQNRKVMIPWLLCQCCGYSELTRHIPDAYNYESNVYFGG